MFAARNMLFASSAAALSYRSTVLADNPVAYWRLGESSGTTAADEMGSYPGTHVNVPTFGTAGAVSGNSATTYDGVSDHTTIPNITGLSAFTLAAWVKSRSLANDNHAIFYSDNFPSSPRFCIGLKRHAAEAHINGTGGICAFTALPSATWSHIVIVRNGSTVTVYINSSSVGNITVGSVNMQFPNFRLGCHYYNSANREFSDCDIDEVAIFNTALSPERIAAHYNAGIAGNQLIYNLSPALWLDASDASTLYDATTGGNLVSADGAVARWEDKSGNSRHATQATISLRPLRKTSIQNSRDVVRFDGTGDTLIGVIGTSFSAMTVFAVFRHASSTNTWGRVYTQRGGNGPNDYDQTGHYIPILSANSTANPRAYSSYANSAARALFSATVPIGSCVICSSIHTGAQISNRINGGSAVTYSHALGNNSAAYAVGGSVYGATTGDPSGNDIAEIIVFPTALSLSQRQQVEKWLGAKWGTPVPSDDEYFIQSLSPALWLSDTGSDPSVWNDLSGNGRHATQATAANQPSIVTGVKNGRQVRRFDGTDDFLTTAQILTNQPFTAFAVVQTTKNDSPALGASSSSSAVASIGVCSRRNTGAHILFCGTALASGAFPSVFTLLSNVANSTSSAIYANGTLIVSGDAGPRYDVRAIGYNYNNGTPSFFGGDIAEILVFPTALSTTDRQRVENYLNAKWAIY